MNIDIGGQEDSTVTFTLKEFVAALTDARRREHRRIVEKLQSMARENEPPVYVGQPQAAYMPWPWLDLAADAIANDPEANR